MTSHSEVEIKCRASVRARLVAGCLVITIPKGVRESSHLSPGDLILLESTGDTATITMTNLTRKHEGQIQDGRNDQPLRPNTGDQNDGN